jgi:hypothetical protein
MSLFKFSNRRPILKYMTVSHILKSTSNDVSDLNPNPNQYVGYKSENLEMTPIWGVDVDLTPASDLSISYIFIRTDREL